MTEPSGKASEKRELLRDAEEDEVEEEGMVEATASGSTTTREKDTTEKGSRERGDGEHSRGPGESKERARRRGKVPLGERTSRGRRRSVGRRSGSLGQGTAMGRYMRLNI